MHRVSGRQTKAFVGLLALCVLGPMCGGGGGGGGGGGSPGGGGPPFQVLATFPLQNDLNVARTQTIYLTVNGNTDPTTLNGNITLLGNPNPIPIALVWDPVLSQIKITPQGPNFMQQNTSHTVQVTAGVKTMSGTAMTPKTFSFSTVNSTDVSPPTFGGATSAAIVLPTTTGITVNWSAGSDTTTSPPQLVYDLYVGTTTGQINFAGAPWDTSAAGATSHTLAGLNPNSSYVIVVLCRDQAGNQGGSTAIEVSNKTMVSFATNIYQQIIQSAGRCATCHTSGGISAFMDLSISAHDVVVNKWVNIPADTGTSGTQACQSYSYKRVTPNDLSQSLVYQKISLTTPPCGVRMPEDGATAGYLNSAQIQVFADWINQGANDN